MHYLRSRAQKWCVLQAPSRSTPESTVSLFCLQTNEPTLLAEEAMKAIQRDPLIEAGLTADLICIDEEG